MPHSSIEARRAYARAYRDKNREKINKQQQAARARNLDRARQRERERAKRRVAAGRGREYYARNGQALRDYSLWWRHGLRPEDWAALWQEQDGRCYLCGDELVTGKAHIDHDHSCCPRKRNLSRSCRICRRGLACNDCNTAIGLAHDDPVQLRRMADALEAAQLAFSQRRDAGGIGTQLLLAADDAS